LYYQHQRLLMDAYSAEHTFDRLLKQAEEKADRLVAQAEANAAQLVAQAEANAAQEKANAAELVAQEKVKAAQAEEEAKEQAKEQIARNLLKEGFDVGMVAKVSGLPRGKVENLMALCQGTHSKFDNGTAL
jgi:regulator of protease activity HflC (stomatin/prohibitin superfamily)